MAYFEERVAVYKDYGCSVQVSPPGLLVLRPGFAGVRIVSVVVPFFEKRILLISL